MWAYAELLQAIGFRKFLSVHSSLVIQPAFRQRLNLLGHAWRDAFGKLAPCTYDLGRHPGISEPGFSETNPLRDLRESELEALTNRDLRHHLHRERIELITYAGL